MSHLYQNERSGGDSGPIPKRWLNCPRKSDNIIAERFIAFKTPLSKAFNDKVPLANRFPPDMILGYCTSIKLKLGLWIDLTNTNRFYDRQMIKDKGIKYIKLQCEGHGQTPTVEQTRSFIEIVDNFIDERPLDLIGVHCTHGFNRTGFLITSYLVERGGCSLEAALQIFSEARAPGIYKQDYIDELFQRYGIPEDTLSAPELPDWCFEEEEEEDEVGLDNGNLGFQNNNLKRKFDSNGNGNNNSNNQMNKKRRREIIIKNPKFMTDDIRDIYPVTDLRLLREIQGIVQKMCDWKDSGFPGSQPVSLNMVNMKNLETMPYSVSWKADGARYMMLIKEKNQIYFIDRNNSCFEIRNMTFLRRDLKEHLTNTLLDGEMVLDKFEGKVTPRYLVYDIVKYDNRNVCKERFRPERLEYIKTRIIEPRVMAFEMGIINRENEPFSVRFKEFYDITFSEALLGENFAKKLLHDPDGLIFQPSEEPYVPGVADNVFKWKPNEMNSIDFRLKIYEENRLGMLRKKTGFLYVGGQSNHFATMKYKKSLQQYDNKIIECFRDENKEWQFMRERTDKIHPNSVSTAESVLFSIEHPVTKEILLNFIKRHGYNTMPPPSTMHVHRSASQQQQQHYQQHHPHHSSSAHGHHQRPEHMQNRYGQQSQQRPPPQPHHPQHQHQPQQQQLHQRPHAPQQPQQYYQPTNPQHLQQQQQHHHHQQKQQQMQQRHLQQQAPLHLQQQQQQQQQHHLQQQQQQFVHVQQQDEQEEDSDQDQDQDHPNDSDNVSSTQSDSDSEPHQQLPDHAQHRQQFMHSQQNQEHHQDDDFNHEEEPQQHQQQLQHTQLYSQHPAVAAASASANQNYSEEYSHSDSEPQDDPDDSHQSDDDFEEVDDQEDDEADLEQEDDNPY